VRAGTGLGDWWSRSGLDHALAIDDVDVEVVGADPVLPARHRIGDAAASALALVGAHANAIGTARGAPPSSVRVDVQHAAATLLGFALQRAPGVDLTRVRNATIRQYRTRDDRWIHLHGGFPRLAAGLLGLLGLPDDAEDDARAIGAAVAAYDGQELEDSIAAAGLCGVLARSPQEWDRHPHGSHLGTQPVVTVERIGDAPVEPFLPLGSDRPRSLDGLRVLDQTRVLAGPTCGRTLASLGAPVLRISSPTVPSIEPFDVETGHGKRNAYVDLTTDDGQATFVELVRGADVVTQSYRPGALGRLGAGAADLAACRPGIVVVEVSCYGSTGPWSERPGWEQLAQTASGIAWIEGDVDHGGEPCLLPAAATDYTTGYLAAAGALVALRRRATEGGSWLVRASLAQTAGWLRGGGLVEPSEACGLGDVADRQRTVASAWGSLTHLPPALELDATPCRWDRAPEPLGTSEPRWW
jgi:crotonobetainyl-CoA:carnitine CoA-transferase CaiB-like acyl-CoA transferase